jgi:hypothetical protein
MQRGDFINLITTYASHFRELDAKDSVDIVLTDFINFIAANQGIDYGIYASDLARHKRRNYNPVDSDVMINMSKQIEDLKDVIKTIYMNTDDDRVCNVIENIAIKYHFENQLNR